MSDVVVVFRRTFYAPTARRHFMTAPAAAKREASAMLSRKYPKEGADRDDFGRITYAGWHWSDDEHLTAVHKRLTSMILSKLRGNRYAK